MSCPYHGYQCNGLCQMASAQAQGNQQYYNSLMQQLHNSKALTQPTTITVKETQPNKRNKLLLLE